MFLSVVRFQSKHIKRTVYSTQAASRGGEEKCIHPYPYYLDANLCSQSYDYILWEPDVNILHV